MHSVTLLRRDSEAPASAVRGRERPSPGGLRGTWSCVASIGDDPCLRPEDGDTEVPVGDDLILVLRGRALAAEDQRVLAAFATQVAVAYQQRRLAEAAEAAAPLAEADRMRTALLNAVSHDLRTPIASAKAAVSSLRSPEVDLERAGPAGAARQRRRGARPAHRAGHQPARPVAAAGRRAVGRRRARSASTTSSAGRSTTPRRGAPDRGRRARRRCPRCSADAGLLERVIANLVENALRYTPAGEPVRVAASTHGDMVELRVIDRGPGIPPDERESVFAPFQRRDDHATSTSGGVGLGLAIARGFIEAMHGTITLEDTPGGGLTAVVALPVVRMS